ncbi:FAD-dependent oxidoreductase [Nonomuraea jiangxiensis]|uniref:NADPH-dependent 2,4-dienoyl-CoA reductase, sulfur reductase n=1 Tax=Nonomuraea jiangxiensis TaxID=633440 RepID=A0A1G8JPI0_9ACTN|nr:FAD-dependent oxidoreductase [Nonomuraea jiangxiensis]SDI33164.1 NADPH-dependent 2,4-dienoyl-CoA reductase, sulfur reductase [Nonomuraea jiangxiensis]
MRVVVDLTRCQGYGQCAFAAPDVFRMGRAETLMYTLNPDDANRDQVLRAAAACPVRALVVDELGPLGRPRKPNGSRTATTTPGRGGTPGGIGRIVIVGASLAGLRAAATLRTQGYQGSLTLIGDEPCEPYDRPPLSKQVLSGEVAAEETVLPMRAELDADWLLGTPATGLDLAGKRVLLADGRDVGFDRLLIATGVRARPWPDPAEAALDGVYVLRGRADAALLRRRLRDGTGSGVGRVLVIGGGFTGSEIASACRELGLDVTVAERGPAPLVGALGEAIGSIAGDLQREHGVDLRCGVTVTALEGDGDGRLRRARLSDGGTVDAEVAVVALGAVRNVEWLEGSGLAAGVWGVGCDAGCRAFDVNGIVSDDIFVAGDVARFPHPVYGYQFLALEHWGNALTQAEVAAHNMISAPTARWPHLSLPVFWSAQFGVNIKSVGVPTFADEVMITQGSVADRRFVAAYGRHGRLSAAVTFDQAMWLEFYQDLIERAAPFPPDFAMVGRPPDERPVPAGIPERISAIQDATVVVTGHNPDERRVTLLRGHE